MELFIHFSTILTFKPSEKPLLWWI